MRNSPFRTVMPIALLLCSWSALPAQESAPPPPTPPVAAVPEVPEVPDVPNLEGDGIWQVPKGKVHEGRAVKFVQAVSIDGTLDGSLWAFSKDTRVAGKVTGNLQATGERAVISGEVGEDTRLIVADARIDGIVRGDLTFAGGKIVIGPKARVEGDAVLTGQEVEILGTIVGETKVAGGVLRFSGVIENDARVDVDEFIVDPGARIDGDLGFAARKATDLRGTGVVKGSLHEDGREIVEAPAVTQSPIVIHPRSGRSSSREDDDGTGLTFFLVFYVVLLALGSALVALGRRLVPNLVTNLRDEPLQCVGVGFLAWLSPFAAIFVAILIVTIPLVIAYWFLFFAMVPFTYVPVSAWVGDLIFRRLGRENASRYTQFAGGLAVWWLAVQVPVLGVMVLVATFLAGPGTVVISTRNWWVQRKRNKSQPSAPPPDAAPATV
ncbi:MAG TPA: polymer-forming cytoskeletal protein [Candidatus Polarisedimenticolaceae bacterium]